MNGVGSHIAAGSVQRRQTIKLLNAPESLIDGGSAGFRKASEFGILSGICLLIASRCRSLCGRDMLVIVQKLTCYPKLVGIRKTNRSIFCRTFILILD